MTKRLLPADWDEAAIYIRKRLESHPYEIVQALRFTQLACDARMDGKFGPGSWAAYHGKQADVKPCFPVPIWQGKEPEISSHHADSNPYRPTHRGSDIVFKIDGKWVPLGATVPCLNVLAGQVIRVEERSNGWCVAVEHLDGRISQHRHLDKVLVEVGEFVEWGEELALFDQTQEFPHEHFELYERGVYVYERSVDARHFLEDAARIEIECHLAALP